MWSRAAVQAIGEDLLSGSAQQAKRCQRKQQNMFVAKSTKKYHQLALPTLHIVSNALLWQFGYMALGLGWNGMIGWGEWYEGMGHTLRGALLF